MTNKPILCRYTMPKDYKTIEQWEMFIDARKEDIEELEYVIKKDKEYKKELKKEPRN